MTWRTNRKTRTRYQAKSSDEKIARLIKGEDPVLVNPSDEELQTAIEFLEARDSGESDEDRKRVEKLNAERRKKEKIHENFGADY